MEPQEIIEIITRRRDSLSNSTSIVDASELTVTRSSVTRLLADEYISLLCEIEKPTAKPKDKEPEVLRLAVRPRNMARFFR
jgi:hypothetical protein